MASLGDMRRRLINSSVVDVKFREKKPGCWSYDDFIVSRKEDQLYATKGDLTIPVTGVELLELLMLAEKKCR